MVKENFGIGRSELALIHAFSIIHSFTMIEENLLKCEGNGLHREEKGQVCKGYGGKGQGYNGEDKGAHM